MIHLRSMRMFENNIPAAKEFAIKKHGPQMYGDFPYSKHLNDVYNVAKRFKIEDPSILVACYLHDTVEDTKTELNEIHIYFGEEVRDIVYRVTNEEGSNRKETAEKTYPKIKGHLKATHVKLCDRIANMESSLKTKNHNKFKMYKQEFKKFKELVYQEGIAENLWAHLEELSNTKY